MSSIRKYGNFRFFCLHNFPFLEKNFDALTDYELICKIFEYFNEQIENVDKKIDEIDERVTNKLSDYSSNIEELREEIQNLLNSFEEFKNIINNEFNDFEVKILNEVEEKLNNYYPTIIDLLNNYEKTFDEKILKLYDELNQKILDIETGKIDVYDPTKGLILPIQDVIKNVYEILRPAPIEALAYDNLDYTAQDYDNFEDDGESGIKAIRYDLYSKNILNHLAVSLYDVSKSLSEK